MINVPSDLTVSVVPFHVPEAASTFLMVIMGDSTFLFSKYKHIELSSIKFKYSFGTMI